MDVRAKFYFDGAGVGVAADAPFFREIGDFLLSLFVWLRFPITMRSFMGC